MLVSMDWIPSCLVEDVCCAASFIIRYNLLSFSAISHFLYPLLICSLTYMLFPFLFELQGVSRELIHLCLGEFG